jgi:hypothetical protein
MGWGVAWGVILNGLRILAAVAAGASHGLLLTDGRLQAIPHSVKARHVVVRATTIGVELASQCLVAYVQQLPIKFLPPRVCAVAAALPPPAMLLCDDRRYAPRRRNHIQ